MSEEADAFADVPLQRALDSEANINAVVQLDSEANINAAVHEQRKTSIIPGILYKLYSTTLNE
jgi:hypothetical protein